jgi:parvulin-like peptidyl-prolyl isomerase
MRRKLSLSLVLLLFALPACGDLLDPAAAVVGGQKITFEEVQAGVDHFKQTDRYQELSSEQDSTRVLRQYEQGHLATLVRRAVLEPYARDLGIEVTEDQVDAQMELIRQDFPDEESFQSALAEQALTEEQLEELVRDRLLEQALQAEVASDATPSDAEIQAYYEEHIEDAQEAAIQHVLVEPDQRGLANTIAQRLQNAPSGRVDALFERLARQHSTDPGSAEQGGMLGYAPLSQFVPPFAEAAAELDLGVISDPVETDFGWHVLRVIDRRERSLEEMRPEIAEQLSGPAQEAAWAAWLQQAYEDADVRINPRYGELDFESGQILDADAETIPGGEAPGEGGDPGAPPGFEDEGHSDDDGDDH